ncbi:Na(+)-translocating NADH-quinone reductase subunit D [Anaerohalosphaera lusitana]|uniref:Na(+)-translocating NADH-quinone reductase subunit D n=1 Tax=Anaerohalosphaera lusitana TaxID=1936003 RepID=A0A1U9NNM0_9BACT|nr:Rnf-Nqr domain containing protein [Anaerohalosphaera lusitana]AQT69489.1 Na(+)-translocating NADH-quinone reductase subunit D [Anaerohalosphaera lusitana]
MTNGEQAKTTGGIMVQGLWYNNPVFRQILGICSTLAVTNVVMNTLVMCVSLTLVLTFSALTVSALRKVTPHSIRMMVQTLIIAFYVIIVDVILKGYWPEMSENLGPYVGLIITNCIIMGRCEGFARSNPIWPSIVDGFSNGVGYSMLLLVIATSRELLGMGSILGYPMPYFSTIWDKWTIMVMPPGAFFALACTIWLCRSFKPREEAK